MSNIHTNFIDFRDEHRIYFLEGNLLELVGMIADTDYDDLDEKYKDYMKWIRYEK